MSTYLTIHTHTDSDNYTSTFILLDSMLERIKTKRTIKVYEFLVGLRKERVLIYSADSGMSKVSPAVILAVACT